MIHNAQDAVRLKIGTTYSSTNAWNLRKLKTTLTKSDDANEDSIKINRIVSDISKFLKKIKYSLKLTMKFWECETCFEE